MSNPSEPLPLDLSRIAQDLQLRKVQVEAAVQLFDEGNTPSFIARYRKDRAGGLDEDRLRVIRDRVGDLRALADRKSTILRAIEAQGKLTDDLRHAKPVYETLPGWQQDITKVRTLEGLPKQARAYLDRISQLIGRPVDVVSIGPDREQTIFAQRTT